MFKKEISVNYNEKEGIIYLTNGEDEFEGKVNINHDTREIRVYNFNKSDLTDEEKSKIVHAILKESYLFPNCMKSNEIIKGNVAEYYLLINGYLIDGSFKEPGKKYDTLIENFLNSKYYIDDECEELKANIRFFYNQYHSQIGKSAVKIYLTRKGIISGIKSYNNFSRLFATYLKIKGKKFRFITTSNIFEKEREIIILPY